MIPACSGALAEPAGFIGESTVRALRRGMALALRESAYERLLMSLMKTADLLADEPISSLDPRNASIVMEALRKINREDGITVICKLHTLDTARTYCERIIGMKLGAIVFDGNPAELTVPLLRDLYSVGADEDDEEFSTAITSTSIEVATDESKSEQPGG